MEEKTTNKNPFVPNEHCVAAWLEAKEREYSAGKSGSASQGWPN